MTAINRLTNNSVLSDYDLIPIWCEDAGRTRSVNATTLADYVIGEIGEGKYISSGYLSGGVLTLLYNNGQSFTIDGFDTGSHVDHDQFETQITGQGEFVTHNLNRYLDPDQLVIDESNGHTQIVSCENIDSSDSVSKNVCKILSSTPMNGLLILR